MKDEQDINAFNDPHATLQGAFGHNEFRGCQLDVINHVLQGRHAMVVMPTGMGKSVCYQIPALLSRSSTRDVTLVLSPLVALMKDQVDGLISKGISATYINSTLDRQTRNKRYQQIADGQFDLLYVTPERFRKPEFNASLAQRDVKLLAVDEAHCVSQWGHDFRPDYSRLKDIRAQIGRPTTIALTATATEECRIDIYRQLGIADNEIRLFHEGIDRPNLKLDVEPVHDESEKLDRIDECLTDDCLIDGDLAGGSVIVYFTLIKTLQRFSDHLMANRVDHVCYHGDLPRDKRRRVQDEFMTGDADLVLATNAFGMGVDKANIRMVVHAETPSAIESYYQEIGRSGRDGLPSRCVWLYDQADLMTQMQFIEWSNPDASFYGRVYDAIRDHAEECRAFGMEWLNSRLQRVSRHDHRLDTVIGMLDRYGVIAGPRPPECFQVVGDLPHEFCDDDALGIKKRRDQERLYEMVKFAAEPPESRQAFLNEYFMGNSASK